MRYNEQTNLKLYTYSNNAFTLQAIIDDFQEISFEHNLYEAGQFTISINYNIPNALKFERGLFVQFGSNPYDFGEILTVQDSIGEDGKGSQIRTITGYDARYLLKRRVIKNMNSNGLWAMTDKGEIVLRSLIQDQCGSNAEAKRQLPITNVIPASESALGKEFSVSENFTNLYEVCKTIATQSEIGWRIKFDGTLTLEVYEGQDLSQTVRFDTNFESLANGEFSDSAESYTNAIYIGGKGQNDDRDIYEGEDGEPSGLDRFESWDNQSSMTTESEYEAEALSMLTQYGQTLTMNGNGLAKCPYVFREQYDIGDTVTVAFSGKSAKAQILSITEHWTWGSYDISFAFGKPQNNLSDQLQLMLRKIQEASNKTNSTDSVRWYTIPTDSVMPKADVTYNTIGFTGTCADGGSTFTLYLDTEKTGAKTYHVYFKQLAGGNITLTTGRSGATDLVLNSGTYVAIIYVDENGNVTSQGSTPTSTIASGNNQPVESGAVASALSGKQDTLTFDSNSTFGSNNPVKSNGLFAEKYAYVKSSQKNTAGWYKIISCSRRNMGESLKIELLSNYNATPSSAHSIQIEYGWLGINIFDMANDSYNVFDKIRYCYNKNNNDEKAIYVHYRPNNLNGISFNVFGGVMVASTVTLHNFVTDEITWENTIEYNLGTSGFYINGEKIDLSQYLRGNLDSTQTEIYTGDLNDIQYGNYFVSSSATNKPPLESTAGFLMALFRSTSYQEQIMFFTSTRNIYHRVRFNGTWSVWQSLQSTFIGKYSYTRDTALSSTIYLKIYERAGVGAPYIGAPIHLFGDCGLISSNKKTPFDITIDFRIPNYIGLIYGQVSSNQQAYIDIIPTWDNDTNTARIYVAIKARYAYIRLQSTVTLLSPTEDSAMLGTAGSSMFDRATRLRGLQNQTLSTPITIAGQSYTTVESALQALAGAI